MRKQKDLLKEKREQKKEKREQKKPNLSQIFYNCLISDGDGAFLYTG